MGNQDTHAAWTYHDGTKHPDGALFDTQHTYTGAMRPLLFKVYSDLPPTPLPLDPTSRGAPALDAELWDGSGTVTLVWLGRRRIKGIDPGRSIVVRGRVSVIDGQRTIFNPTYELRPTG